MINIKLGDKVYDGVTSVKLDTSDGGTVEFSPYEETFAAGKAEGVEEGQKAEYDKFWDAYQDYGNRTEYSTARGNFGGKFWTDEIFKPKYPMNVTNGSSMFRQTGITDFTKDDIRLDFSKCTDMDYTFAYSGNVKLPFVDLSSATKTTQTFGELTSDSLTVKFSENTKILNPFVRMKKLVNLTVDGTVGMNISFSDSSLLSSESVQSVIDHLKDLTGLTSQTLTVHADVGANMTESQKATITAKNWTLVY